MWPLRWVPMGVWGVAALMVAALAAGCAWYGYSMGRQAGMAQVQAAWDAERLATQQAQAEELMKARQREQALQAMVDRQRRAHREEVDRIVREHAVLVDGLRDRPDSPGGGGVPEGADAGAGSAGWCTGARLYRDHAAAFAGESALAAQLQSALRTCLADRAEIERRLNRPSDER